MLHDIECAWIVVIQWYSVTVQLLNCSNYVVLSGRLVEVWDSDHDICAIVKTSLMLISLTSCLRSTSNLTLYM